MFFRQGLMLACTGLLLGLPLSVLAVRVIAAAVRWPMATPSLIATGIVVLVLVVASLASWIPARRASRIQPIVALSE